MTKRILPAVLLCAALAGCATTRAPIPAVGGESLVPLVREKIAVSYQLVDKHIGYAEVLYHGLWVRRHAAAPDFSGIWQPDREMTDYLATRLRQQGFMADSAYVLANADAIEAHTRQTAALARRTALTTPADNPYIRLPPTTTAFEDPVNTAEFRKLAGQLQARGYRYLAEFTSMNLISAAPGYGLIILGDGPNLRFIELATGRVIWSGNAVYAETYQLGGDFRRLEQNDLQGLKYGLRFAVSKLDFVGLLGVKPYGSDW
jgi:hypothetical protein